MSSKRSPVDDSFVDIAENDASKKIICAFSLPMSPSYSALNGRIETWNDGQKHVVFEQVDLDKFVSLDSGPSVFLIGIQLSQALAEFKRIQHLRQKSPGAVLVVVSDNNDSEFINHLYGLGITAFFPLQSIGEDFLNLLKSLSGLAKDSRLLRIQSEEMIRQMKALRELNEKLTQEMKATKALQEEREITLAKSLTSSKLASLGEMAAGIAHEINNPLSIIKGKAYQVRKLVNVPQQQNAAQLTEHLVSIDQTVDRIAKIIKGLRSFSRNGDKDDIIVQDVFAMIDDTLAFCSERLKNNGVELRLDINRSKETLVDCRPVQIVQVLLNLLNNAFDAVVDKPNPWIKLSISTTQSEVLLRVTDSGTGIPDTVVAKMMEPFFSTKPVGKGTGLGLSISRGIVEEHHGKLSYELHDGHTSFVIELPFAACAILPKTG